MKRDGRHTFLVLTIVVALGLGLTAFPPSAYAGAKEIPVVVDLKGFNPATISVAKGEKVKLVFTRKTDQTCATAVIIPDYKIHKELPLNKPVAIEIEPKGSGEIGFSCPAKMLTGKIKVSG